MDFMICHSKIPKVLVSYSIYYSGRTNIPKFYVSIKGRVRFRAEGKLDAEVGNFWRSAEFAKDCFHLFIIRHKDVYKDI